MWVPEGQEHYGQHCQLHVNRQAIAATRHRVLKIPETEEQPAKVVGGPRARSAAAAAALVAVGEEAGIVYDIESISHSVGAVRRHVRDSEEQSLDFGAYYYQTVGVTDPGQVGQGHSEAVPEDRTTD